MSVVSAMSELVEWDWVYTTGYGNRLHHLADGDLDALENEGSTMGRATCGLRVRFSIPGMFSRMGMQRCVRCCARLGYPCGVGAPKNDDACRPLVAARLELILRAPQPREELRPPTGEEA